MNRTPAISRALILVLLVAAFAGSGNASGDAERDEESVAVSPEVDLSEIRDRAESMPIDRRIDIDKRIGVTVERVNAQAKDKGHGAVAARLASEFATTSEALLEEKSRHGLNWGEMVIAHTILANSAGTVTLLDLMALRSEGLGWGAIAFGLRFHMEDFEDAIKAQGRVAMGLSKVDGKAAVIGR